MAVAYRSSSVTGTADAQDAGKNIPVPTGAAADDIALLAIEVWLDTSTDPVITWPSGFTQKISYESTTDGFQRMFIGWKRLTGADTGTYNYTISGSYWNMAHCILISGAATTGDPIEATNTAQSTGTSTPSTSVTMTTAGALVHFVMNENSASATPPTSFTEVQDGNYVHTNYRLPGASGTYTTSGGSTSVSTLQLAALLAVKAAGAGGSDVAGTAATSITMTATATGLKQVTGTVAPSIAMTATVTGVPEVLGSVTSSIAMTATAIGSVNGVTVNGVADSSVSVTATATSQREAVTSAQENISVSATISAQRTTFGVATAGIGFFATATMGGLMAIDGRTLTYHMNRKANTIVNGVPTLTAQGAANVWAGTTGLDLVHALNVKAGNGIGAYRELAGVLNQLAGTSGLEVDGASAMIP